MKNKTVLKGLPPSDPWFDQAWIAANKRCEAALNLIAIPDIESGYPIVMTKEENEKYIALLESFKPKFDSKVPVGKIIYFGTGGEMDNRDWDFNKIFGDPKPNT